MSDDGPEVHISGMSESDAYRYLDATKNEELRELINEWRENATEAKERDRNPGLNAMIASSFDEAADDLEALIE